MLSYLSSFLFYTFVSSSLYPCTYCSGCLQASVLVKSSISFSATRLGNTRRMLLSDNTLLKTQMTSKTSTIVIVVTQPNTSHYTHHCCYSPPHLNCLHYSTTSSTSSASSSSSSSAFLRSGIYLANCSILAMFFIGYCGLLASLSQFSPATFTFSFVMCPTHLILLLTVIPRKKATVPRTSLRCFIVVFLSTISTPDCYSPSRVMTRDSHHV